MFQFCSIVSYFCLFLTIIIAQDKPHRDINFLMVDQGGQVSHFSQFYKRILPEIMLIFSSGKFFLGKITYQLMLFCKW